jgi:hypothetical protein
MFPVARGSICLFGRAAAISFGTRATYDTYQY